MFIVNSDGNICEEIRQLKIIICKNENLIKEAEEKAKELEKIYYTLFPFGVYHREVEKELKIFLKEREVAIELAVIYVNDTEFGVYDRKAGEAIFQEIVSALNRKETLFNLRDYEEMNKD